MVPPADGGVPRPAGQGRTLTDEEGNAAGRVEQAKRSAQATSDQRALTFAGALTVDLVQKQKDSGGGVGGLIGS